MERRREERMPASEAVTLSFRRKLFSGTILNLSESGIFVGTRAYFPCDSIILIESKLLKIVGRVTRHTVNRGHYEGVAFLLADPSMDYIEFVRSF